MAEVKHADSGSFLQLQQNVAVFFGSGNRNITDTEVLYLRINCNVCGFFFYYVCKYRKLIDGQKCSYKRQPPEKAVNAEVIAIIRQAMKSPDLVRLMRDYTNAQTDGAELQKRLDEVEKTRRQKVTMKDRISVDLDSIDLSDETAEMEYEDLKARQKKIYEEIIVIDREIRDIKGNMKHQADSKATLKTARRLMEEAGEKLLADDIEDIGKKLMLQCMIEHVDLYEEKTNGRYVKGITFNFPVMLDSEITEQWWDKGNPVERVIQLIKKYLKSEVMKNGVCVKTEEGSPQGGPMSPLLANIYTSRRFIRKTHLQDVVFLVRSSCAIIRW